MLEDEYLRAKIGVDTTENEPKVDLGNYGILVFLILNPMRSFGSISAEAEQSGRTGETSSSS